MIWLIVYLFICFYSGVLVYAVEPQLLEEIFNVEDHGYDAYCVEYSRGLL